MTDQASMNNPNVREEHDTELLAACYLAMQRAMKYIDPEEGPGREHSQALSALADCRVRIENRSAIRAGLTKNEFGLPLATLSTPTAPKGGEAELVARLKVAGRALFRERKVYFEDLETLLDVIAYLERLATNPDPEANGGVDIGAMVNRFLCWRLPQDFAPDGGISFTPTVPAPEWTHDCWPVGTNLFTAAQAHAMFKHCVPNPEASTPTSDRGDAVAATGVNIKGIAREVHDAISDEGVAPLSPADNSIMRAAIEYALECALLTTPAAVAQPVTVTVGRLFWDAADNERGHDSIEELLSYLWEGSGIEDGAVVTVQRALKLPDLQVRVHVPASYPDGDTEITWSAITPDTKGAGQ